MLDRVGRGAGGAERAGATASDGPGAGTGGLERALGDAARARLAATGGVLASAARSVGGEGAGEGVGGEAGRAVLREAAAELGRDLARLGARELGGLGDLLRAAFGAKAEGPAGRALGARLAAGEVPMPALRLVGDETLPAGARGAYSSQGEGTVFLHRELMGDPAALRRVLAEELGHHLDRLLGGGDAKGDEGALFARLLAGERLGAGELAALRREDDRGRLRDGRAVELFSFGLGNASGGGLSFGGSATGGALDVGAGGGTELSFGEGVGAVGRDALTSAEGLSMGTTGAGSEGTTASSPRGELSLGERVSDDDEGTRTAKVAAAAVGLVPGVGAAADAQASADRQARWGDAQGRLPGSAEEWRERGAAMVEGWVERGAAGLAEMDRATREAAARAPGADGRPAPEAWALSFALGETAASGRGEAAFREGALQRAFELDPLGAAQGHAGSGLSFGRALSGESLTKQGVVLDGVAGGDVSKRAGKAIVSGLVGDAQVGALDGRARTAERRDRESALRHGLAASIAAVHGRGGRVEIAAGVEAIEAALATPEGLDYLRAAKALGAKERSEALAALAADPRAAVASAGEGAKGEAADAQVLQAQQVQTTGGSSLSPGVVPVEKGLLQRTGAVVSGVVARAVSGPVGWAVTAGLWAAPSFQSASTKGVAAQQRSADQLGLDTGTLAGSRGAAAHAALSSAPGWAGEPSGRPDGAGPSRSSDDEIAAQVRTVMEMANPGLMMTDPRYAREVEAIVAQAEAEGRLAARDGGWAQGLPEIFRQIDPLGRDVWEIEGLTPEQRTAFEAEAQGMDDLTDEQRDLLRGNGGSVPLDPLPSLPGFLIDPGAGRPGTTGSPQVQLPEWQESFDALPEELQGPTVWEHYGGEITVPAGVMDVPGFDERADELAWEGSRYNPEEGRAGARLEATLGVRLGRPDERDRSVDFIDESGTRIEIKGPLVRDDGRPVTEDMIDGLITSTVREADQQTAADIIVVDTEGLTEEQAQRVREALRDRVKSDRLVVTQR